MRTYFWRLFLFVVLSSSLKSAFCISRATLLGSLAQHTTNPTHAQTSLIIREALMNDLEQLLALDRRVFLDYFKPIYTNGYAHLEIGKNPDYFLELELQNDTIWFPACIEGTAHEHMLVAYDQNAHVCAGFLIFHRHDTHTVELDLLLVDTSYRGVGAGKKLIYQAIAMSGHITSCIVYPIRYANADTLAFYRKIGFADLGPDTRKKINAYGVKCSEMYLYYRLDIQ